MPFELPAGATLTTVAALAVLAATGVTPTPASAHPPERTDHGIPERVFHTLWAGDHDAVDDRSRLTSNADTAIEELSTGTDVPLDAPPRAVARWNRGDHQQFPATNRSVSIHPPDVTLTGGRFIRDAHATIFTVQPATRARLSPSRQPLYVAPNGTLLGTVDYRVAVPANTTTDDRRVTWRLDSHRINETRLLVDGRTATNASGSRTPALAYTLGDAGGQSRSLTLEADIAVELRKTVAVCTDRDDDGDCTNWETSVENRTENVTVDDTIEVVEYDLSVSGFLAHYPNGDLGLVVYKNHPWLGARVPNGDVRGVWRFYAARDDDWDTLVYSNGSGESTTHSPLHPLRITAYPIETGPTPTPRRNVAILDVYGTPTPPPTLPREVRLDALDEPYTASYGIATRAATGDATRFDTVRAWGLVRGVDVTKPTTAFTRVLIHESDLTLTVLNATDETLTVRIRLTDRKSSTPIDTANREGYVVLEGRRVNTSANGTRTVTIDRPPAGVVARYVPGQWWRNHPAYVRDTTTVLAAGPTVDVVGPLYRIGVPVALFLLAGFVIDRVTGWHLWPPWRRL